MANPITSAEELFLKIFKVTVLIFMTLSLVAALLLSLYAVPQFLQTPKEPVPARKAPEKDPAKEINIDQLKNFLLEQEKQKSGPQKAPDQQPEARQSVQYLEDATQLYRCSADFATKIGAKIDTTSDTEDIQRINELRRNLEESASDPLRGERWIKAAVSFTCMALNNDSIILLKKDGRVSSVFYPIIRFHIEAWDKIQNEKVKFEKDEENRVISERNAEENRVAAAKAKALACFATAGGSFGVFMILALYLLISKIESDLSDINKSIKEGGRQIITKEENNTLPPA